MKVRYRIEVRRHGGPWEFAALVVERYEALGMAEQLIDSAQFAAVRVDEVKEILRHVEPEARP